MNRRVFLKGVGGVSLAAPFLSRFEKTAKAQGTPATRAQAPRHLLHAQRLPDEPLVAEGVDVHQRRRHADRRHRGDDLEPLAPYISKLSIPRGFRSMNSYGSGQSIDPHDQAMGSKLTCATIDQRTSATRRPRRSTT